MVSPLPAAHENVSLLGQNHGDSVQSLRLAVQWCFFFLEDVTPGPGKTCKGPEFYGGADPQCSSWIWGKAKGLAPSAAPAPWQLPMEEPGVTCPMALELGTVEVT